MARKKKCDECKKDCIKSEMYAVDHLVQKRNNELETKTLYYCNKECSEAKEKRKELIESCNQLLEELLEMPIRTNMYFNKLYSPIQKAYGYQVIFDMLSSEYGNIAEALNKDFVTANVRIKYFMAIMQNKIEDYKNIEKENTNEEVVVEVYETKYQPKDKKQKKSIFDI